MKKLLLLALVALFLNGCRYINTTDPYVKAEKSPALKIPEGIDTPNSTSRLEVPEAENKKNITEKSNPAPPDMPIRIKQTDDGSSKISSEKGFPVLTVTTDKQSMWETLNSINLESWKITNSDENSCTVTLHYIDQAAIDRGNDGFFKKMFRRDKFYTDYSGDYKLVCEQIGAVIKAKFSKLDGSPAKSYLADNVMSNLYDSFTSE